MKAIQNHIIAGIAGVLGIVATTFALSDNFISRATFNEFKTFVVYRLDTIDGELESINDKLDQLLIDKTQE